MSDERQGVALYGFGVDAVAEALRALDPRYVLVGRGALVAGQVSVLCCLNAAEADAARGSSTGVAWLVVELSRPGVFLDHASHPVLALNTSKINPVVAARAIDQADLEVWYEVVNPVRFTTVDAKPAAADYSNLKIVVPEGHRMVAHAVRAGEGAPECLPGNAERVLPSHDLWVLAGLRKVEVCQACTRARCRDLLSQKARDRVDVGRLDLRYRGLLGAGDGTRLSAIGAEVVRWNPRWSGAVRQIRRCNGLPDVEQFVDAAEVSIPSCALAVHHVIPSPDVLGVVTSALSETMDEVGDKADTRDACTGASYLRTRVWLVGR